MQAGSGFWCGPADFKSAAFAGFATRPRTTVPLRRAGRKLQKRVSALVLTPEGPTCQGTLHPGPGAAPWCQSGVSKQS